MNMINPASMAYRQHLAPSRSPRSLEYELMARITQRLRLSWDGRGHDFPALAQALRDNAELWATLAADVADDGNALPVKLRAGLFYLYEFTAEHSSKVLSGKGGVDVLIDINTAVMRGLRGVPGAGL